MGVNVLVGINDQATKQFNTITRGMQSTMFKLSAVLGGIRLFKGAIDSASDLGESVNALNNLIGEDGSEAIQDYADSVASSVGMAKNEFVGLATSFSGVMKNASAAGLTTADDISALVERVGDVGSMFNLSAESLESGLTSALAGRTSQTLAKIGVDLTQTAIDARIAAGAFEEFGISTNQTMTQLDADTQSLLRLQSFMLETDVAANDFANTLGESLPNQMKSFQQKLTDLGASVGEKLIPPLIKLMDVLGPIVELIAENIALIGALTAAFAAFKVISLVAKLWTLVSAYAAMALAKTAAETGPAAVVAVPAVAAVLAAAIGTFAAFGGFSGGGTSSSASSTTTPKVDNTISISIDKNNNASVASNGLGQTNVQTSVNGSVA